MVLVATAMVQVVLGFSSAASAAGRQVDRVRQFAAAPAPSPGGQLTVRFENKGAFVVAELCLRNSLSVPWTGDKTPNERRDAGGAIHCRSRDLLVNQEVNLTVDLESDGSAYVDFKIGLGPTKEAYDVSGRKWCKFSGTVQGGKMECEDVERAASAPPVPSIAPFDPGSAADENGQRADLTLLNLLAWCVTAAGVAGLLVVGTNMALQLHRGVMGFGSSFARRVFLIVMSCFLAMAAGPIVQFLNIPLP
ncbi:hypothetical protein [Micromonospora sp. NBC_00858]|uniref:hypothetical protein n=1 Tax=Micromonospora sp. NBC_00858 TaxID=2975979 RepID=UPI00386627F2|nr:hypothetical protein OG990_04135 [Micromonospora sp. NBC_00858]